MENLAPGGVGISVVGVRRTFGSVVAVDSMSFEAPPGVVTALVGPNGAGKTTLLLMLASLLVPDSGSIRIAGHDPVKAPAQVRRAMGWMPDTFGTYDNLTAREVLEFVAAAYRLPKAVHTARARELLELVHLAEFAERPVHVLSRGQKQRLGLARAIVHSPAVLLLDEPASGLDPRSRVELRGMLRSLAGSGCAILVSSHILAELEEMADAAVFVAGGRTVASQSVAQLRAADAPVPWRIRALEPDRLLAALAAYGVPHDPPDAAGEFASRPIGTAGEFASRPIGTAGVQVLLRGDADAAELLAALVRDGVRVAAIAPAGGALESAYLALTEDRR